MTYVVFFKSQAIVKLISNPCFDLDLPPTPHPEQPSIGVLGGCHNTLNACPWR